jgi:hypothetical protein
MKNLSPSSWILWPALVVLGTALAGVAAQGAAPAAPRANEALLIDCAGHFLRLSTADMRILAQGNLWDRPKLAAFSPRAGSADECAVADVEIDRLHQLAYIALARGQQHLIAALHLPDLGLVTLHEIESAAAGPLRLLLSPGGDELLASYSHLEGAAGTADWLNMIERLSAPTLRSNRVSKELRLGAAAAAGRPSSAPLSRFAGWAGAGRILDQTRILDDSGRILEHLDPYALMTPAMASGLGSLERLSTAGRPYLPIAFADSAARRVLFAIGHDTGLATAPANSALWVHDVGSNLSLRPILTRERVAAYDPTRSETPSVHLSPDGDLILLERFEWRPAVGADETQMARFKTGPVDVYDVNAGALLRTINLDPSPGFTSRLLAISPAGDLALFGTANLLYVVPLDGRRPPTVLKPDVGFEPFWSLGGIYE